MKNKTTMKKSLFAAVVCLYAVSQPSNAAVSFAGTALSGNVTGQWVTGDRGVLVSASSSDNWSLFSNALNSGISLTSTNSTLLSTGGTTFTILSSNVATALGITAPANFNILTSDPSNPSVVQGQQFAMLVFDTSSTTTVASDPFRIYRAANWTIPADGSSNTFGTAFTQINSGSAASSLVGSFTVIPEPSTYALMALGGLVLFFIARRRKAQV
jgi:hypothetical protein